LAIKHSFHAVVNAVAHIDIKAPRLTKERFIAGGAAAVPVAGGVILGIRLRFHNHAPEQLAIRLAFHQPATNQVGCHQLRWATEEGVRERLGKGGGYGSGYRWAVSSVLTAAAGWAILGLTTPRPLQEMSEEQLKAFLEAVKADAGLQEQLKAAADADAVVAIAKAAGFAISADELKKAQSEISEDELEGVAGGCDLSAAYGHKNGNFLATWAVESWC